ncbi:MAG: alginate O-acetyltransferase AlgX-related protein [Bacteroidota bacterium]
MKFSYAHLFSAAFIALLMVPLRTLALDPETIGDRFYGRQELISLASDARILIGDRVFPNVIVGEHGWLMYTAESDLDDYQKVGLFKQARLAQIQESLDALSSRYAERGITLLVVIAPNKNTIYPERVPDQIRVIGEQTPLDQLTAYLREHGKTQLLDLRPALLAARRQREIYYSTDTHWNDYGAYIAYAEIMSALHGTFPNLEARPQTDFRAITEPPELLDLSKNTGSTLFPESRVRLSPLFETHTRYRDVAVGARKLMFSTNPNATLPRVVVYHDSFFFRVIPLLGEHFSSGLFVQSNIAGGLWSLSWVDELKPDVVIIEFAERYLKNLPELLDTQ